MPLRVRQHVRSRHWQHCNAVCNAESDSFAEVIRPLIDCVGSYRVKQELKKIVLSLSILMVFLLSAARGGVTHPHLKQCPARGVPVRSD